MRENAFSFRISVRAWHDTLDVTQLAGALNLETKNSWKAGDNLRKGVGTRSEFFWCSEGFSGEEEKLEATLDMVLHRLSEKQDVLNTFTVTGGRLELFVGIFLKEEAAGVEFRATVFRALAELGVDLSLDVYIDTD